MMTANKIPAERSLNEPICRECARFPLSDDGFPLGILDSGLQTSHLVLSQLQPHFIFNVLNMIYYMIGKEPNTARRMLDDFSSYLRSNIGVLDSPTPVSLEAEISHVNLYLRFEQMRYVDRFRVEYDLGAMDFKLPPLTLQPLVENAVRHGLFPLDEGGVVRIESAEEPDCYLVRISDNGVGCESEKAARGQSLQAIRSRIEEMTGGSFSFRSAPGSGATVEIRIPKSSALSV